MIDIHSHIIFGVDDGPQTLNESKALLQAAYDQGVKTIIATSHRRKDLFTSNEQCIAKQFSIVQQAAREIADELTVLYGAEIYLNEYALEQMAKNYYPTLAGTHFVLVEFAKEASVKTMRKSLNTLLLQGVTPVIAHIERYTQLEQHAQAVRDLIELGCYMQVNASSVLKPALFGDREKKYKKRAHYFLMHDLVHFIASDMHNLTNRPPMMKQAYQIVHQKYGRARARRLFSENQELLLANEYL